VPYDRLGRLASTNNPEAGYVTYSYDNEDQLITTQDGREKIGHRT
jgi:YD repeat-containing protein